MIIFAAVLQSACLNSGLLLHKNTFNFDCGRYIFSFVMVPGCDLAKQAENHIIDSLYSSYAYMLFQVRLLLSLVQLRLLISKSAENYFRYITCILGILSSFVNIIN